MAHASTSANLAVSNLFDFSKHVVLVTGGATGLGEMGAQAFIQNGAYVLIASRKKSELEKTAARLNKLGPGKCDYIVADLKDKAGCQALCEDVKKKTDRLTVLLNNSGATWGAPYDDFPESGWDKLMALNVKSIFYTTVGLHDLLTKGATADNPSRVINIASMAGITTVDVTVGEEGGLAAPGSGTFSYGPSKAACIHLSKGQASKLMPHHVTVNCICPGVFPSRMTAFGMESAMDTLVSGQPSGRVGKPDDFGGLVLFLSSRGAAHMTGNVLELDGGATLSGFRSRKKSQSKEKL
ncbi:Putative short-chain dehydrogenase/reductase SDR, NAD(P)-binding domain superfamily [Septoria linicola]|uniref:Short-chain dehydrogenase/reductase SDR, NAD(P)-binding domain superfamily n=1 Tax=Septoria linicola TaxID=215465 RepID=A0A9Q9AYT6_9PEZI|nr:putative short-chain dehydrogenase/reductase SDR, NAD(P)-binding domain superfamily [Septoria linicola]USW58507.1 Putative short-chain dehydrogenase/reductase SDR, NAD(P)-binding domain superfamily [Septoria linicola]